MRHERARIRVLICDDVEDLRALYRLCLGAEPDLEMVGEASDGSEAVQLTDSLSPDVVLLDVHMPVMNGLDALSRITSLHPATKVIMLTGFVNEHLAEDARARGAAAYIAKGTSLKEVADRIRSVVLEPGRSPP